jgi:glycosyltransferase involved in cell wall biosynthesis
MSRLNIAFVNAEHPNLAPTGYLLLTRQLIGIIGRAHCLNVIILNAADLGNAETDIRVLNRRSKDRGKRLGQLLSVFSRHSMVVHQTRFPSCKESLAACLNELQPDVVIFNHIRSAWLAPEVQRLGFRSVYIAHNAEGATARSIAEMCGFGLMRFLLRREARKVDELESRILQAVEHVVALTPEDAVRLRTLVPHTHVAVIPPSVETRDCCPVAPQDEVLLLGSFRWLPKRLNAIWLAREVMPRVRARRPDVQLRIVGAEANRLSAPLRHCQGVTIHADVPKVEDYYTRAGVFAVPERQAGGIKLKTLEAATFGKAIVTTPAGCEGTGLRDRINCLLGDTADEFAARILEFIENPALREAFGAAARSHVGTHFSATSVAVMYDDLLERFSSEHRPIGQLYETHLVER